MTIKTLKKYKLFKNIKLLKLELLKEQGFCNTNYLLKSKNKKYLIRVFKNNNSVNISREFEYETQKKAARKNLAAAPLLLTKKFMVCTYLEGKHKNKLKNKELKKLVKNIKKLHKIKSKVRAYDLKKDLKYYKRSLKNQKSKILIKILKQEIKKLKNYKINLVTTHHDLNPKNILFHKKTIKFIDFEYAGVNDKYFDLATIAHEFKLNKKQKNILIKTYNKKVKTKDIKKLNTYIKIYKILCKLWFIDLEQQNKLLLL